MGVASKLVTKGTDYAVMLNLLATVAPTMDDIKNDPNKTLKPSASKRKWTKSQLAESKVRDGQGNRSSLGEALGLVSQENGKSRKGKGKAKGGKSFKGVCEGGAPTSPSTTGQGKSQTPHGGKGGKPEDKNK